AALMRGECEFPQIGAVSESSLSARGCLHHGGGNATVHGLEVSVERGSRVSPDCERGPVIEEAAQNEGLRCLNGPIELGRGLDLGYGHGRKPAQEAVRLRRRKAGHGGCHAAEPWQMFCRYESCVGCSSTFLR